MATDCHFPAVDLKMPELTIILAMYWFNTCRYGITAVNMLCTSPKGVTPACLVLRLLPRFVVHKITTAGGGATNKTDQRKSSSTVLVSCPDPFSVFPKGVWA